MYLKKILTSLIDLIFFLLFVDFIISFFLSFHFLLVKSELAGVFSMFFLFLTVLNIFLKK